MNLTPLALTRMVAMENFRPALPDSVPETLADLIRDCWAPNPNSRPNFETVLSRLDGEIHDEIYNEVLEDEPKPTTGHFDSPRARERRTRGKNDAEGAIRGFRVTMEAEALHKNVRGITGIGKMPENRSGHSRDKIPLNRASSGSNVSMGSAAPARRGMHLKKMMSVKRAPGAVGEMMGNQSLRAAKGSLPIGRVSGSSIAPGKGLPGLNSQSSVQFASAASGSSPGAQDASLVLMQNKNALAKATAENESLKKALKQAKKEAEESKKRAGETCDERRTRNAHPRSLPSLFPHFLFLCPLTLTQPFPHSRSPQITPQRN
jgi:hypothetical protein